MINSFAIKVFVIGGICKLLKQSGKVVFAEACCFCNLVKGKIFRAVFINIIADGKKTIQIFFLLLRSGIKTAGCKGLVSADQRKNIKHARIDNSFRKKGILFIFRKNLADKMINIGIDVRSGLRSKSENRGNQREDGIEIRPSSRMPMKMPILLPPG